MANRSPARRYLPLRVAPGTYALLRELADRETGGNVSRMVRTLMREALVARRAVLQTGRPENRRAARIAMDSAMDSGWSRGHAPVSPDSAQNSGASRGSSAPAASGCRGRCGWPYCCRGFLAGHAASVRPVEAGLTATAGEDDPPTIHDGCRLLDLL
jgi:hypothetical protein